MPYVLAEVLAAANMALHGTVPLTQPLWPCSSVLGNSYPITSEEGSLLLWGVLRRGWYLLITLVISRANHHLDFFGQSFIFWS